MTDRNGNLKKQEIYIPNDDQISGFTIRSQQYEYDSLNRLLSAREVLSNIEQWKQQFTYDRWGNRTIDTGVTYGTGINNKAFTVNTSNNRLGVPGGQSGVMSYDAAGNLTNDTYTGAGNRIYDAENKIVSAWGGNNQAQLYAYDASGQRIKRTVDGVTTWQVYGFGGELLAEYAANGATASPQKEYGYRNGQLLITASPSAGAGGSGSANSLSVNGSTAYVEVPNSSSLNIAGALTMEAWIKLPSASTGYQPIIDKSPSLGNEGGYDLYVTDTGKVRMDIYYSPSYQWLIGNTTITAGVWHHIAGVYDGSQLRLYVDGQLDGSVNLSSPMTGSTVQLRIGKNNYLYGPLYFNGLIDEVRISTGALYNSNFTPAGSLTASGSTKGLWRFDGQTANDTSSNANHGTLNGGASYSSDVPAGGGGGSAQNVTWTNVLGVSVNGNSLTKTGTGDVWNAGASSTKAIMSGDGYLEFTASETSSYRMIGLSNGDSNQSYQELDFAFYLGVNGYLFIYENGVNVNFPGFYATGDTLRISVESGVVKYRKNGTVVYTSTATPTYPLLVDTALYTASCTINNVVISGNLGSSASTVQWLVADHLGTPRMILDQSGNLAAVKRHDYLPFGEELFAGTSGRTAAQGYGCPPGQQGCTGDKVRQQFTQKERDVETGLDYFGARYYVNSQGRFSSADPLLSSAREKDPKTWNRYSYALNNPLAFVDPSGLYVFDSSVSEEQRKQFEAALAKARSDLSVIEKTYGKKSTQYKKAERALNAYGAKGVNNGVTIFASNNVGVGKGGAVQVAGVVGQKTTDNPTGQNIHITFDSIAFGSDTFESGVAHEGAHAADASDWVKSGFADSANPTTYQFETDGYIVSSLFDEAANPNLSTSTRSPFFKEPGKNPYLPERIFIFKPEWAGTDRATLTAFRQNIDSLLSRPERAGGYGVTSTSGELAFLKNSNFRR